MIEESGYAERDRARWVAEPAKRPGRSGFERDRARVLHASALRRLAGKTQVVDPGESDFPRTRLTHSLECAQIGRELGQALGCDPDLVEAGCLAHDLGHPPFGHNGEAALDSVSSGCGGFEGNAQSLRILTRLEAKAFTASGRSAGLNLTRAVLDAATKYPWPRRETEPYSDTYGVYAGDMEVFGWIREDAPGQQSCLEAQIMDWADDVAYSVHDLEDGVHAGHVDLARLRDPGERRQVCAIAAARYAVAAPDELEESFGRLLDLSYWPAGYDGSHRALAALKDLTSQLIGRFCSAAEKETRDVYGAGMLRRYGADLIVPREQLRECAVLKGVTARYVMDRAGASGTRAHQREVITELAGALWRGAPGVLEPAFATAFARADDDGTRLRVVVDQIASLTDASALVWHRRLVHSG